MTMYNTKIQIELNNSIVTYGESEEVRINKVKNILENIELPKGYVEDSFKIIEIKREENL